MAVHVLDQLDLFGMEVETPFHGRGIYLVPFVLRQEPVFMSETPEYNLVFPVALEHGSFIVLRELRRKEDPNWHATLLYVQQHNGYERSVPE